MSSEKEYVDTLVKKAYENWNQVVEYDGKSLMSFKQPKRLNSSRNELSMGSIDYPNGLNSQLLSPRVPASVSSEPSSMNSRLLIGGSGYDDKLATQYQCKTQLVDTDSRGQFDNSAFTSNNQRIINSHQIQNKSI